MTDFPASHRDLLEGQGFATLATFAPSGYPQVTAVSFFFDEQDQEVKLSLNETRKKVRNLQRDPRCNLFLLDFANPLRYLEIRADAELRQPLAQQLEGRPRGLGGAQRIPLRAVIGRAIPLAISRRCRRRSPRPGAT